MKFVTRVGRIHIIDHRGTEEDQGLLYTIQRANIEIDRELTNKQKTRTAMMRASYEQAMKLADAATEKVRAAHGRSTPPAIRNCSAPFIPPARPVRRPGAACWRMRGGSPTIFARHHSSGSSPPRKAAGSGARVGCEPGQVRKEAALNRTGPVPPVPRSPSAAVALPPSRATLHHHPVATLNVKVVPGARHDPAELCCDGLRCAFFRWDLRRSIQPQLRDQRGQLWVGRVDSAAA